MRRKYNVGQKVFWVVYDEIAYSVTGQSKFEKKIPFEVTEVSDDGVVATEIVEGDRRPMKVLIDDSTEEHFFVEE